MIFVLELMGGHTPFWKNRLWADEGRTDGRFYYNVCKRKIVYERKRLKNYFRKLQVPLCAIFWPHSVAAARLSRPHLDKIFHKLVLAACEKPFSDMLWWTVTGYCKSQTESSDSLSSVRKLVYNGIGHDNRPQRRVGKRRGERWKKEKWEVPWVLF